MLKEILKTKLAIIFFIFIISKSLAQNADEKALFQLVEQKTGVFIFSKRGNFKGFANFSTIDTKTDSLKLRMSSNSKNSKFIPREIFLELSNKLYLSNDSSKWNQLEFKNKIFINFRDEWLFWKKIKPFVSVSSQKAVKKQIRKFNYTNPLLRQIYEISGPIFSKDGIFAIIAIDCPLGYLGGGGSLNIYKKIDGRWEFYEFANKWAY